jgi:hypothetical protein
MSDPIALDLRRGAERVSLGLTKFREEADAGRIRTFRVGRRRMVSDRALRDYVELLEAEARGTHGEGRLP